MAFPRGVYVKSGLLGYLQIFISPHMLQLRTRAHRDEELVTESAGPSINGGGINRYHFGGGQPEPTVKQTEQLSEYLTKKQLSALLQMSESTIENRTNLESRWYDREFPKPRLIGLGRCAAKRWLRSEVHAYVLSRPTK